MIQLAAYYIFVLTSKRKTFSHVSKILLLSSGLMGLTVNAFSATIGTSNSHIITHSNKKSITKKSTAKTHHKHSKKSFAKKKIERTLPLAELNVPTYFYKDRSANPIEPISETLVPQAQPSASSKLVASMEQHLVNFVHNTVATLRYSDYKLGGRKFDSSQGVYIVDCSSFVDNILAKVTPNAYNSLVNATASTAPTTFHYYQFFSDLRADSNSYWNKINEVEKLRAGDILVFRYKQTRGASGHVMVVMGKPIRDSNVFFVRVADSAPYKHSQDTRQGNEGGIGIGTLLLKVNPQTGKPSAYAWGVGSYWKENVKIAMARPLDHHGTGLLSTLTA
jgi:hypothetical protein